MKDVSKDSLNNDRGGSRISRRCSILAQGFFSHLVAIGQSEINWTLVEQYNKEQ